MDLLIFTTIVVKITNPKSGLNLIANSSSPVLSAPSFYSTGARRYPLSYVYSGTYSWGVGDLYNQGSVGYGMSTTAQSDRGAYFLSVHSGGLVPQGNDSKTYSLPLCCVSTQARRYPLSYVLSGRYFWNTTAGGGYDKLDFQGTYGFWWTSAPISATGAYSMGINGGLVAREDGKAAGFPLRSISTRRYPLSYVFAGVYWLSGGTLDGQGAYSIWRSSTAIDNDNAYGLSTNSSSLLPQNSNHKNYGFPLRQRRANPLALLLLFWGSRPPLLTCRRYARLSL